MKRHFPHSGRPCLAVVLVGVCALGLFSCDDLEGSGEYGEQVRQVAYFDQVVVWQGMQVHLTVDPSLTRQDPIYLKVGGDHNLLDHVRIEQHGDQVAIRWPSGLQPRITPRVIAYVPPIRDIVVEGDAAVVANHLTGDLVGIVAHGGRVLANGAVDGLSVFPEDGAHVDLRGVTARRVNIEAFDGSYASICVSHTADVRATSDAVVDVYCGPAEMVADASDGGHVVPR